MPRPISLSFDTCCKYPQNILAYWQQLLWLFGCKLSITNITMFSSVMWFQLFPWSALDCKWPPSGAAMVLGGYFLVQATIGHTFRNLRHLVHSSKLNYLFCLPSYQCWEWVMPAWQPGDGHMLSFNNYVWHYQYEPWVIVVIWSLNWVIVGYWYRCKVFDAWP